MITFITEADKIECCKMVEEFYQTSAVDHSIPSEYINNTVEFALSDNPYNKILICQHDNKYAGYCQLSFTYSGEVGGLVVLIEELYIRDEFKGKGLGTSLLKFIRNEYDGKAKRYRLEVTQDNANAIKLYERLGFEELPYKQMILDI